MQTPGYHAFSYTHVLYPDGDRLGWVFALLTLTPIFVMVSYATLLASRRDLATAALTAGQLLNEVLNYVLKHAVREPRPTHVHTHWKDQPKFAMPSNHAQFVGFTATYLVLWVVRRWRVPAAYRALAVAGLLGGAAAVGVSRVYLAYHTTAQILVGWAVGAAAGCAWFGVTESVLRPLFPRVASWPLSRALLLRDCSAVEDVLTVEYEATVRAAAAGRKRLAVGSGGDGGGVFDGPKQS
jgi:dolichyldiphosphatase